MKYLFYLILLSSLLTYSCKKDQDNDNCRVVSLRYTLGGNSYNNGTVTYDENGNLKKIDFTSDTVLSNFEVKYSSDTIHILKKKNGNVKFPLDDKNRITGAIGYFQPFTFSYGADGFIESGASQNATSKFYYEGNNLIQIIDQDIVGGYKATYNFSYNTNEKAVDLVWGTNPIYYYLPRGTILPPAAFFGNTSKNRLQSVQIIQENPIYDYRSVITHTLSYKIDDRKNVESVKIDYVANSKGIFDEEFHFQYECK